MPAWIPDRAARIRRARIASPVVGLPVVDQPDIEPDPGHLGRQALSGAQFRQGRLPFTAAHVNYRQVAVGAHVVWLGGQNLAEVLLRGAEVAASECLLSLLEGRRRAVRLGGGPQRHEESQNHEAVAWQEAAFHRTHISVSENKRREAPFQSRPPCAFTAEPWLEACGAGLQLRRTLVRLDFGLEDELQPQLQDARVVRAAGMQEALVETTRSPAELFDPP